MKAEANGLRIAYLAHTVRSDWNNGNAHFVRGLLRGLQALGHAVTVLEPECAWSIENLRQEALGGRSLEQFAAVYPELAVKTYEAEAARMTDGAWAELLGGAQIVIVHEWNTPELARRLLAMREALGYKLLFHDTHHRASSSPELMEQYGLEQFDGVLAFGEALRALYRERFGLERVWTLHEAADTTVFQPDEGAEKTTDGVWIGNWGEDERAAEIRGFYLRPAAALAGRYRFALYGVRYPGPALDALATAGVHYGGYLPNLDAPAVYGAARLTVHIPRQQYSSAMHGIPTIRVFEALACGIPLLSAPWQDMEQLFDAGDFVMVKNTGEMTEAMRWLLEDESAARAQAARGLATIRARHTCAHRARELAAICREVLA